MDQELILILIVIILALIFSAFFSGMEIAFISANRLKIELDNKKGGFKAKVLAYFAKKPSWFIGAMLIGNNIALVIYSLYMAFILKPLFTEWFDHAGFVLFSQTVFSTLFVLVFAEFLPKAIFRINPNGLLHVMAYPLMFIYGFLWIPTLIVIGLTEGILTFFVSKNNNENEKIAFEKVDLDNYLSEVTNDVEVEEELEHEVKIFHNALGFSQVIARDCMIPRNEIVAFEIEENINELKQKFIETGLSKILIYRDSIDNIIGYVHCLELFGRPEHIKSILLPISIIPESITANKILEEFIAKKRSISIVVDEFGGTSGMVTMEDVIEEIFGEIDDEHDLDDMTHYQKSEFEFEFSGRVEIDFINEKYRLNFPVKEDYETLGGMIIHYTESIPKKGQFISIGNFKILIKEVSNTRIEWVSVFLIKEDSKNNTIQ